jgi:hypothetical protein
VVRVGLLDPREALVVAGQRLVVAPAKPRDHAGLVEHLRQLVGVRRGAVQRERAVDLPLRVLELAFAAICMREVGAHVGLVPGPQRIAAHARQAGQRGAKARAGLLRRPVDLDELTDPQVTERLEGRIAGAAGQRQPLLEVDARALQGPEQLLGPPARQHGRRQLGRPGRRPRPRQRLIEEAQRLASEAAAQQRSIGAARQREHPRRRRRSRVAERMRVRGDQVVEVEVEAQRRLSAGRRRRHREVAAELRVKTGVAVGEADGQLGISRPGVRPANSRIVS